MIFSLEVIWRFHHFIDLTFPLTVFVHAIYYLKWQEDGNKKLHCWYLTAESFQATFPFSPSTPHLVSQWERLGPLSPGADEKAQTKYTPSHVQDSSPQPHLLPTLKTRATHHTSFVQGKWTGLNASPTLPRKPRDVNNKLFHILLVHVWHLWPQDSNQFGVWVAGMTLPFHRGTPRWLVLRAVVGLKDAQYLLEAFLLLLPVNYLALQPAGKSTLWATP